MIDILVLHLNEIWRGNRVSCVVLKQLPLSLQTKCKRVFWESSNSTLIGQDDADDPTLITRSSTLVKIQCEHLFFRNSSPAKVTG